jgi:hypothetical protein
MKERRGKRPMHDIGLRTRKSDRDTQHGVPESTSTFHLRWFGHVKTARRANRKAA